MAEKKKILATKIEAGSQLIHCDRYKLQTAKRKFNKSWKAGAPDLVDQNHSHHWNHINIRNGFPNERSSFIGGHCHMVKAEWDESGKNLISVHCGPPLKEIEVKGPRGFVKKLVPVTFKVGDEFGGGHITDDHTHDVEYVESLTISAKALQQKRKEESENLKANLIAGHGMNQAQALSQAELAASKAAQYGIKQG